MLWRWCSVESTIARFEAARNRLTGRGCLEAGGFGDRQETALSIGPSERGFIRAQDEAFDLLAAAFPLGDLSGAHFALDRSPETASSFGVPAL